MKILTEHRLLHHAQIRRISLEPYAPRLVTSTPTALAKALGYPPEYVFRQAGLLPPKKETSDPQFDRFEARLTLLTPENRERIFRLIELEYQLQLEQEQAQQKSTAAKPLTQEG